MAATAAASSSSGINRMALSFLLSLLSDNLHNSEDTSVKHHWAYSGPEGPDTWHLHYAKCGGSRQSPINIESRTCVYDPDLGPFYLDNFHEVSTKSGSTVMNVTNNGHAASVRVSSQMRVRGGGLPGTYRTAEFHFHWGSHDGVGSEHALDGRKFPLEMHIVNFAEKYGDVKSAMSKPDGLAVLGVFFEVSDMDNGDLFELDGALKNVQKAGEHNVVSNLRLRSLLPADTSRYWRYQGSLTTPHCFESVTWTVFQQPQKISRSQLETLRSMLYEDGHEVTNRDPAHHNRPSRLVDNWRPLQPRNERLVRRSFKVKQQSQSALFSSLKSDSDDSSKPSTTRSQASISEQNAATIRMLRQKIFALERMVMASVSNNWSNDNLTVTSAANTVPTPEPSSAMANWTPRYFTQRAIKSTKAPRTTQPAQAVQASQDGSAGRNSMPRTMNRFSLPSRYIVAGSKDADKNTKPTDQNKGMTQISYNVPETKLRHQTMSSSDGVSGQSRQSQSGRFLQQKMMAQNRARSQNSQQFADPIHQEILHNILIPQQEPITNNQMSIQRSSSNQGMASLQDQRNAPVARQRFPASSMSRPSQYSQNSMQSRSLADHISAVNSVASKSSPLISSAAGIPNLGRSNYNSFSRDQKSGMDVMSLTPYEFAPSNNRGGMVVADAFPQVYLQRLQQPVRIRRPFYERMYNWPQRNAQSVQPRNSLTQTQLLSLHNTQGGELPELI